METLNTGGGTFVTKLTHLDERILMLLNTNFFSIENTFDSNGNASSNTNQIINSKEQNKQTTKTFNKLTDQTSKLTEQTDQNSENIIIIYEPEENHDTTANTDVMQLSLSDVEHDMSSNRNMTRFDKTVAEKSYRSLEYQNNRVYEDLNEDIESCQASIGITPKIPSESIEELVATPQSNQGKKRKLNSILKEKNVGRQSLVNKKMELLEKKSSILDIIKDVETENLKSKKLDNEIKQIIKEREKLDLKMKYKEYENL